MPDMQYVVFESGKEDYAIPIEYVKEIVLPQFITGVPNSRPDILGVISLRNQTIPIINFSKVLGQLESAHDRIVILDNAGNLLGILVGDVKEVLTYDADNIESVPALLEDNRYIKGIIHQGDQLVGLFSIEQLFDPNLRGCNATC